MSFFQRCTNRGIVTTPSQFDQIQFRESEAEELEQLKILIPCDIRVSRHARHMFRCLTFSTEGY